MAKDAEVAPSFQPLMGGSRSFSGGSWGLSGRSHDRGHGEISETQAFKRLESGRPWVWTAVDPVSKLLLAIEVGPRTVEMAQRVVHQIASVLAPDCLPAWFSDGFKGYLPAIVGHFGRWIEPERLRDKGRRRKPRWMPLPDLLYAQVVKQYRRKRVVGVKHRVVFGTMEAVAQVLAACGWKINTSMVERLNLDIQQRVAAIGRRVNTICQGEEGLQHQLALFQVYHNFILPHVSLRQPLPIPEPPMARAQPACGGHIRQPWQRV